MSNLIVALAIPPGLVAAASCGPSVQSIHEGSVRFEHCYRLDLDPNIAPSHRHACWKHWIGVYSYGQARDRMEYARRRLNQLEAGDPSPPRLNLEDEDARPTRQFYMSMPAPTNAHAPPPPVAPAPELEPKPDPVPGDECVISCREKRAACLARCGNAGRAGAAKSEKPTDKVKPATPVEESNHSECACEADYKSCASRCFQ